MAQSLNSSAPSPAKIATRAGVLALFALIYLIVMVGCIRSGALLINERDDLALAGAVAAYALTIPATLIFAVMATRRAQQLLKGDPK